MSDKPKGSGFKIWRVTVSLVIWSIWLGSVNYKGMHGNVFE